MRIHAPDQVKTAGRGRKKSDILNERKKGRNGPTAEGIKNYCYIFTTKNEGKSHKFFVLIKLKSPQRFNGNLNI